MQLERQSGMVEEACGGHLFEGKSVLVAPRKKVELSRAHLLHGGVCDAHRPQRRHGRLENPIRHSCAGDAVGVRQIRFYVENGSAVDESLVNQQRTLYV